MEKVKKQYFRTAVVCIEVKEGLTSVLLRDLKELLRLNRINQADSTIIDSDDSRGYFKGFFVLEAAEKVENWLKSKGFECYPLD
jgi:spermidine synthase